MDAAAAAVGARSEDPACRSHSFCEVLQLFARAARNDVQARVAVSTDVVSRRCHYAAGDVSARECGRTPDNEDGCGLYFDRPVDEAEQRKHLVRVGPVSRGSKDVGAAPGYLLPRMPIEVRAIRAAVVRCLPDFRADPPLADPYPVENQSHPPLWWPVGLDRPLTFAREVGSVSQTVELNFNIVNAEVLEHLNEGDLEGNEPRWRYVLNFYAAEPADASATSDAQHP